MYAVTDADREAAEELRVLLADQSGFWHVPGDAGPICVALARHRERTERQMLERMQSTPRAAVVSLVSAARDAPLPSTEAQARRKSLPLAADRKAFATG